MKNIKIFEEYVNHKGEEVFTKDVDTNLIKSSLKEKIEADYTKTTWTEEEVEKAYDYAMFALLDTGHGDGWEEYKQKMGWSPKKRKKN